VQLAIKPVSSIGSHATNERAARRNSGLLIINADDWGRDRANTDRTLDCIRVGAVSSVSAMVFMEDSERAAAIAGEQGIDAGIHLNFTTPFSRANVPSRLAEHQQRIARYLLRNRFAQVMFHPGLAHAFEYVIAYQLAEFVRLYGAEARRIDGHHHMHLCANVIFGRLLPEGTIVRRNFSFRSGEKSLPNRVYREWLDGRLARHHRIVDYFFSIEPVEPADRFRDIASLAGRYVVEIESHPVRPEEYRFFHAGGIRSACGDIEVASGFEMPLGCTARSVQVDDVVAANTKSVQAEGRNHNRSISGPAFVSQTAQIRRAPRATVLVGFAEAIAAVEVVWSLMDQGYDVIAFARKGRSCALRHSRHVVCHEICAPEIDFETSLSDLRSLLTSITNNNVSSRCLLFPVDDKAVLLCGTVNVDNGWILAGPDGAHAELALNKHLQIQIARAAGFQVPKTTLVRSGDELREFVRMQSYPIILKSAHCVPIEAGRISVFPHWVCANDEELERALQQWRERVPLLAQPFIAGTGEGLFGLAAADGIRAWSAHRRLRMMNPHGSGSSACVSQNVAEDLKRNAEEFVQRTGWRGMFMIELLRDSSGKIFFVEFNGRAWGSMALSRRQHLEYPAWQVMLASDPDSPAGLEAYGAPGIVSRHAGRELMHLLFVLRGPKSKAFTAWPSPWKSVVDVLRLGRGEALYNWRPADKKVFFADLYYTIKANLIKTVH
jgi:predicted glycoside hydrolase/deacetylase ChbG (UPF0249 family)